MLEAIAVVWGIIYIILVFKLPIVSSQYFISGTILLVPNLQEFHLHILELLYLTSFFLYLCPKYIVTH